MAQFEAEVAAANARSPPRGRKRKGSRMRIGAAASVASDDEFPSSLHVDPQRQRDLLNNMSESSRRFEEDAIALVHDEAAEDATERGRVAGGDGDGNAVYVNDSGRGVCGGTRGRRKLP